MRDAVDLGRFVPGADIDPKADRHGRDRVDPVGDDPETIGERREADCHATAIKPPSSCCPLAQPCPLADKAADRGDVMGNTATRSGFSMMSPSASGSFGRSPVARSTASGELCGMRGRERDHRRTAVVAREGSPRGGDSDRGMRVDQHAATPVGVADLGERAGIVDPVPGKGLAGGLPGLVVRRQGAVAAERGDCLRHGGAVAPLQLEQQPLEIARDLDSMLGLRLGLTSAMVIAPVAR